MSDTLYRKVGRRYVPVAVDTIGYQPGIWLVFRAVRGSNKLYVGPLGDVPNPPAAAALLVHVDKAAAAISDLKREAGPGVWPSAWDMARVALLAAAKGGRS